MLYCSHYSAYEFHTCCFCVINELSERFTRYKSKNYCMSTLLRSLIQVELTMLLNWTYLLPNSPRFLDVLREVKNIVLYMRLSAPM